MKKIKVIVCLVLCLMLSVLHVSAYDYQYSEYDGYGYYGHVELDEYDEYEDEEDYEQPSGASEFEFTKNILISAVIGLVIALVITGIMLSKMKTVRFQNTARNYVRLNSMAIKRSHDIYLYSNVVKTPRPQNNNNKR